MQNFIKSAILAQCFLVSIQGSVLAAETTLRKCVATKQCPDSGTICKTAPRGTTILQDDPLQFSEEIGGNGGSSAPFEPPTDTEKLATGLMSDALETDPSESELVFEDLLDQIPNSDSRNGSIMTNLSNSSLNLTNGAMLGTVLRVNGWKCEIIKISYTASNSSKPPSPLADASADVTLTVPTSDADSSAAVLSMKLKEGKIVSLGPITCKVTGVQGTSHSTEAGRTSDNSKILTTAAETTTSTSTTSTTTTAASSLSSSSGSSTTQVPQITTAKQADVMDVVSKATTSTTTPTTVAIGSSKATAAPTTIASLLSSSITRPKIAVTSKPADVGRCVCDNDRRFACMSDDECFMRFQNRAILCFASTVCPSIIGTTGYCRMSSIAEVFNDAE